MDAEPGQIDRSELRRPLAFLSYSRTDLDHARPVIGLLEAAGLDVWWDGRLEGGENYLQTTEAALEGADCVVVLWSQTSVGSHWVRDEAQRGRERGCLVPLSIDGTMAPLGFRQFQILDITGWSGDPASPEAERIMGAVKARMDQAERSLAPVAGPKAFQGGPAKTSGLSRRALITGGAGLAIGTSLIGVWQAGLLSPAGDARASMVVLRFADLTGNQNGAWFPDGLSNELRSVLARNPRLRVSAPTSSGVVESEDDFAIGRKLGVDYILRGSVQRDAARIRVSAELVQIEGAVVQWAQSFDRQLEDVFAVQSEIAETVALSLVAQIASREEARQSISAQKGVGGTQNLAAYEAFLRGNALYDVSSGEESDRAALEQFEAAIALDPDYAAAHAMHATVLAAIANAASGAEEARRLYAASIADARRAIALAPRLAKAQLALGFALNNGELRRKQAYPYYERAQQLAPGDADTVRSAATFYAYGAEQQRAIGMIGSVLTLDPLNARAWSSAGFIHLLARDYRATIEKMERALVLNSNLASAYYAMGTARLMLGEVKAAQTAFQSERIPLFRLTGLAIVKARLGDQAAADTSLGEMVEAYGDASLYQQAQVHSQWGSRDTALTLLERAYAVRDPGMLLAPNDPLLDPVRNNARLAKLLSALNS